MNPLKTLTRCLALLAVGAFQTLHAQPFVHPGILHKQADFDRMAQKVSAGEQPYLDGWNMLVNSTYSQSGWTPRATGQIIRGGTGDNVSLLYNDVARAHQNALRWKISGSTAHGDTARDILNAWSAVLTNVTGNADRYLASGLFGYQLANAAEMMRDYPGFDVAQMQDMLWNVFYKPLVERFLYGNEFGGDHNGACIENYWANWDLCNMAAATAIGIFCDRRDVYERALNYYKYGAGNGSIYHAVPYIHPGELGQWQESGRDQAHTILGVGLMASMCEMAWSQGDDIYGWADNRFMKAAEYVARYNNWNDDVPFSTYQWRNGTTCALQEQTVISSAGRNEYRPVWEMIYNHYANRKGLSVPNIAERAANHRPEGGPGGHATTFDQPGFGTLTYTRPAGGGDSAVLHGGNIANGTYGFTVRHSGKAMEAMGTGNGANVEQWTVNGGPNQQWTISHLLSGEYRIVSVPSGRSMDIANILHDNGANLQLWDATSSHNQRFAFVPISDGYYRVIPAHSGKSLDVYGISTSDGANIVQWKWFGGNNQQFAFVNSPNVPQSAPAGLTATANNVQISLSWTASSDASSYNIKYATRSGGPYMTIATGVTGTSFSESGLSTGTTYYYVVAAANSYGEGAVSAEAGATTIPATPLNLTATAGNAQILLRWRASTGAGSYTIRRSTTSGGSYTIIATGVTSTSHTDASASNGTKYYYVVSAVNEAGESANSGEAGATPNPSGLVHHWKFDETSGTMAANSVSSQNGALSLGAGWASGAVSLNGSGGHVSFPSGFVSTLNDCTVAGWFYLNSVSTWARVFDFGRGTGVNMFLTPQNGSGAIQFSIVTTGSSGQNITGTSVPSTGTWHHFAVTLSGSMGILYVNGAEVGRNATMSLKPSSLGNTTQNWIGRSQWPDPYLNGLVDDFRIYDYGMTASEVAALAGGSSATPPNAPSNLSATTVSSSQIDLAWTDNANNEDGFKIERSTDGVNFTQIATVGVNVTSHSSTGLSASTTYYYRVRAYNSDGDSAYSNTANTTTSSGGDTTPPAVPTGLTATAGDATVSLDWANNTEPDLASYNVKRSTTSGGPYSTIATGVTASAYMDNNVSNGTTYYYVVSAVDTSSNESANSSQVSATPAAPSGSTMHVASIQVDRVNAGGGKSKAQAVVTIVDNNGNPVANATVTVSFTEAIIETKSGVTGSNGVVTITTDGSAGNPAKTTGCVSNVTHASLTYNATANVATCDKSY